MKPSSARPGFPAGNPIANILVIIAGALIIGASIVLGFFAFLALSAIVIVTAAVVGIRVWWLKRKYERGQGAGGREGRDQAPGGIIEGEYKVVVKDRDEP